MKTSLLITTYNRPDALEAVLTSVLTQTVFPSEIIIADDGSDDRTHHVIADFRLRTNIPVKHSWQEDEGFRAAESRNKGLALVSSSYVIMIDGDIIMHTKFIEDHIRFAKPGFFLQGGRNLLSPTLTMKILANAASPFHFSYGREGTEMRIEKRFLAFRAPWLTRLLRRAISYDLSAIRTCNMSFYFEDILKVNGFDNNFVGWGREDSEFVVRLFNQGIKRYNIKFSALCYHLFHKEESRDALPENDLILKNSIQNKLVYCENGLSKFL